VHSETVDRALADFVARVTLRAPGRIRRITLYGSRARGTARPDSDADVLVVVDRRDAALSEIVQGAAQDVDMEHLTCLSVKLCPEAKIEQMRRLDDPFLAAVEAEGRTLWTPTSKAASAIE
jgi:predicted nucleotidyltransferase